MGFTTRLFRRGWQNPDPDKRRKAVEELDDIELLKKVACEDSEVSIRKVALLRIVDEAFLLERICAEKSNSLVVAAVRNLRQQDTLAKVARNTALSVEARVAAVELLTDQEVLEPVAMQDSAKQVRMAAARKVSRHGCLQYLANKDRSSEVRDLAKSRLDGKNNAMTRAFTKNRTSE